MRLFLYHVVQSLSMFKCFKCFKIQMFQNSINAFQPTHDALYFVSFSNSGISRKPGVPAAGGGGTSGTSGR